jgi:hypothetical protein
LRDPLGKATVILAWRAARLAVKEERGDRVVRRILSRISLVSVVGAIVAVMTARGTSSSAAREIRAHESWQGDPVEE